MSMVIIKGRKSKKKRERRLLLNGRRNGRD
jgi:hypothetical protein